MYKLRSDYFNKDDNDYGDDELFPVIRFDFFYFTVIRPITATSSRTW